MSTTAGSSAAVLSARGLHKSFGRFEAVRGVDLVVRPGQVYGFLGPNGAGKTTTLRMITGLLQPSAGTISISGIDTVRDPLQAKKRVGFIGDRPFLYEKLTGAEFLRFVGGLWGMQPEEIAREQAHWMKQLDLQGWAGESVESYSHGMRQRLLICSALIHNPDLLIMDEPMVGLDPRGAARLKEIVRELAETRGMAVLLSTHTLDVVEQVCDAVTIIDRGRVVVSGSLEEVRGAYDAHNERLEQLFLRLTETAADGTAGPSASEANDA